SFAATLVRRPSIPISQPTMISPVHRSPAMANQVASGASHILAHLSRLDLLIRREVLRQRLLRPPQQDDEFRGLYISEDDVDRLLAELGSSNTILSTAAPENEGLATLDRAIAAVTVNLRDHDATNADSDAEPALLRLG